MLIIRKLQALKGAVTIGYHAYKMRYITTEEVDGASVYRVWGPPVQGPDPMDCRPDDGDNWGERYDPHVNHGEIGENS